MTTSPAAPRVDSARTGVAAFCFALFLPTNGDAGDRGGDRAGDRIIANEPAAGRSEGIMPPMARSGDPGGVAATPRPAALATSQRAALLAETGDDPGEKLGHAGDHVF